MSQEKTHKTEAERIGDLENLILAYEDRFIGIERRLTRGGRGPGLEPITFYPLYMPMKGELIGDDATTACFENITTPIDGEFVYAEIDANKDCLPPTAANKADAALKARQNLLTFAKTWCAAGAESTSCTPILSGGLRATYTNGSRVKGKKKECFVTASITGTISCRRA